MSAAGPYIVAVKIPPPGRFCSPNFKGHWSKKAKDGKQSRDDTYLSLKGVTTVKLERAIVSVKWYRGKATGLYRPRDKQNAIASLKWAIDGAIDAGILPDDNADRLSWGEVEIISGQHTFGVVILTFTEQRP